MDEQPDFYYKVEIDGEEIGVMRHITDDDMSFIHRFANRKIAKDDNGNIVFDKNGNPVMDFDFYKLAQAYILCAFGGTEPSGNSRKLGQEGWNLDRKCTIKNINLLQPKIKLALYENIIAKQKEFAENKEAIVKN